MCEVELNVKNCLFYSNSTGHPLGATLYFSTEQDLATPWVVNCTIAGNESGGIGWSGWGGAYPPLVGNTMASGRRPSRRESSKTTKQQVSVPPGRRCRHA
jgi:hypothetical protein